MSNDELKSLFQALREDNAGIRQDIDGLRQDNAAIRQEIITVRELNEAAHEATRQRFDETDRKNEAAHEATRQRFEETDRKNEAAHETTRRHFDVVAEANKHETQLVAEAVALTREALDREATGIRGEVLRTASETQAMFKFSHAELDRRMRTLEEAVSDLQTRVERLETSTH